MSLQICLGTCGMNLNLIVNLKSGCDNSRVLEMFAQNFESSQHRFQVFENHLSRFVLETVGVECARTKAVHSRFSKIIATWSLRQLNSTHKFYMEFGNNF